MSLLMPFLPPGPSLSLVPEPKDALTSFPGWMSIKNGVIL